MLESNPSAGRKREGTRVRGGRIQNPIVRPSKSPNLWSSLPFQKRINSPPINPMKTKLFLTLAIVSVHSCAVLSPLNAYLGYTDSKSGMTYEMTVRPTK